jgi:ATP-binding cassette, subfamily B, multidrug efflux pump
VSGESEHMKSFDWKIVRRLAGYLRPYKVLALIAVIALMAATVAELAGPVILQRTIDRHIMGYYLRYSPQNDTGLEGVGIKALLDNPAVVPGEDGVFYLPQDVASSISGQEKHRLLEAEALEERGWFLVQPDNYSAGEWSRVQALLDPRHGEVLREGEAYAFGRDLLDSFETGERRLLRRSDRLGIAHNAWIYLALLAGNLVFTFLQIYIMAALGQNVMRDLRLSLLGHLLRQALAYLQRTPVGSLVSRLTSDVDTINELFATVAISFIKNFSLMIGVVVTLYIMNPRLATITVFSLPPVILATLYFRVKARKAYRLVRSGVAKVNAYLSEHISGMEVVQMFGREQAVKEAFDKRNDALYDASMKELFVFAPFRASIDFLTTISTGVILYFGAGMFVELSVSLGVLIAFISLIRMFYQPVMDLSEKFTIMQSAMAGGERIFGILDTHQEVPDTGRRRIDNVRGELQFRKVNFSYVPDEPVLKDLSFTVNPGETVAVVGYTGAGKTTIANLLTRFWDIQQGEILIDGFNIRDLLLADLRRFIQPVQQDVFLFSGTIEENITLGASIPREEVVDAAKMVNAHGFIEKLPRGYDTMLQERGSNISTGQKQLISFARVIAQNPRVLILDEATSNVDTETERLIQSALKVLLKGRTSLVIAHRLSTIKNADRILVLSHGHLVEQGSHEELIALKGLYYNLYRLQYSGSAAV